MKLMTLNLWQGRLNRNYPDFIKEVNADFICLQEMYSSDIDLPTLDIFRSVEEVQKASGLKYSYFSPTYSFNVIGAKVQFGNLILSRYPITLKETIFTHSRYLEFNIPSDYVVNIRNAQKIKVDIDGQELVIVNHHGYWVPSADGSKVSLEKLQLLASKLQDTSGPLIVAGDFNLSSATEAIKSFKQTLKLKDLNDGKYPSTLSKEVNPFSVDCDYIFVNENIEDNNFTVSSKLASDHKALILDFSIRS